MEPVSYLSTSILNNNNSLPLENSFLVDNNELDTDFQSFPINSFSPQCDPFNNNNTNTLNNIQLNLANDELNLGLDFINNSNCNIFESYTQIGNSNNNNNNNNDSWNQNVSALNPVHFNPNNGGNIFPSQGQVVNNFGNNLAQVQTPAVSKKANSRTKQSNASKKSDKASVPASKKAKANDETKMAVNISSPTSMGMNSSNSSCTETESLPSSPNSNSNQTNLTFVPSNTELGSNNQVDDETDNSDAAKARRLARKAELARMSRKRKATRMCDLEAEVERLQKEIATLKQAKIARENGETSNVPIQVNSELEENHVQTVNDTLNQIADAYSLYQTQLKTENNNEFQATNNGNGNGSVSVNNFDSLLSTRVEQFVAAHTLANNSALRYLKQLGPHTHSILPLEFFQWLCSQNETFYENPNSLWKTLFVDQLKIDDQQMKDLNALKVTVKKQSKITNDVEKAYKKLNLALSKQVSQRVSNLEKIRSILSTRQLAHYMEWTKKYAQVAINLNQQANTNVVPN